jgi:iron complex outermembrane receptor protein
MKSLYFILIILLGCATTFAQSDPCTYSKVKGKILDIETKDPIPYVSIKIKGEEKYGYTDIHGDFIIENVCSDPNTLIISCNGYCDSVCEDYHKHGKSPHIYMTQDILQLENVTIHAKKKGKEGTKTIAKINLPLAEVKKNPTQSFASLLSEQEGVSLVSTGANIQLPIIHGLYGNRVLVLNNGIKHGFQNWGTDHAPEISLASANSIQILKGAAGVRYGPEALGGVINIEPNPLNLNEPLFAEIATGYQTNGKGVFTHLETGAGFKQWSYFLNGNLTKIGDVHSPEYRLTNSGKEEKSVGLGTRYFHKNVDVKLYYSYVHQNLAILRSSIAESGNAFVKAINSDRPLIIKPFSTDINAPNQVTGHHFLKAEINWWYADNGKLTLRTGTQLNKRKEFDVRRNVNKPIIDLDLITSDYHLEWKHPDWYHLDGLMGIQFFNQDNDNNPGTGTTPLIPNYNTHSFSAFIIESIKKDKNTFEIGSRIDFISNDIRGREPNKKIYRDQYPFSNFTFSLGFVRTISEKTTLRSNIGAAWRTPNMLELYGYGQHGFKTTFGLLRYYLNSDGEFKTDKVLTMESSSVEPEKGYKFINEIEHHNHSNTYKATMYGHYIENFIFDRPFAVLGTVRGPMPGYIYDQANAVFLGTDFTWKKQWSQEVLGVFGVSFLWSQNIDKKEPLINHPPVTTNYRVTWSKNNLWKFDTSRLSLRPSYTFQQYQAPSTIPPENLIDGSVPLTADSEIFDFKAAPEGYFLLNLEWAVQINDLHASISVQNIFNTSYRDYLNEMRYFADEPGRNVLFTLRYLFKSKN